MNEMISYCGLLCHECGAFIATLTNDNTKRAEVAAQWTKEYHKEFNYRTNYSSGRHKIRRSNDASSN